MQFSLIDVIVSFSFLFLGLAFINFFGWRERRRQQKKEQNRYPSASRKRDIPFDETENFYHK